MVRGEGRVSSSDTLERVVTLSDVEFLEESSGEVGRLRPGSVRILERTKVVNLFRSGVDSIDFV